MLIHPLFFKKNEVKGCCNDARVVVQMLHRKGFEDQNIKLLIDDDPAYKHPSHSNVRRAVKWLTSRRKPGDVVFMHFSGHGTQIPVDRPDPNEPDDLDEALVLDDIYLLTDNELRRHFDRLPDGALCTVVADCCHAGTMLDGDEVVIEGAKEDDGDVEVPPEGRALVAALGGKSAIEISRNRSLPIETICQMFAQKTGTEVKPTMSGINGAMAQIFGAAAGHLFNFAAAALEGKDPKGAGGLVGLASEVLSGIATAAGGASASGESQGDDQADGNSGDVGEFLTSLFLGGGSSSRKSESPALISGCHAHETSADVRVGDEKAFGALTKVLTDILQGNENVSHYDLVLKIRATLAHGGFKQNPCLEASEKRAHEAFICES